MALFYNNSQQNMNALQEFAHREADISPDIVSALRDLGGEAVLAYAATELRHKTLSPLLPAILSRGLNALNDEATPDEQDVAFANELFQTKGFYHPDSQRLFDRYIQGTVGERRPGTYFYHFAEDAPENNYGVPERMLILGTEMRYVAAQEGQFSETERRKAQEIANKYREKIYGGENTHIAVIRANPFSPPIINHRLDQLASLTAWRDRPPQDIIEGLRSLDRGVFEGVYIPNSIPPEDLEVLDIKLPVPHSDLNLKQIDPTRSRFFYTPPHLRRL